MNTLTARAMVPAAEAARLLRQRGVTVVGADRLLRATGAALPLVAVAAMAAVVPWGDTAAVADPLGVVWFNAADVLLWAAWWLLGWGGNAAFSLVGGYRFLAQALAYELPLMFALTCPAVAAGSLSPTTIAASQPVWFVVQMPVAAVVFVAAVAAFGAWGPFAHPAGHDAAGGVLAEVSGVDRLLVALGRGGLLLAGAAMTTALFLGGGDGPGLPGWAWAGVKTLAVFAVLVALRRLPAVPAERAMRVAWVVVLPLVLAQVVVTSVLAAVAA